ncbi:MAG: CocE/NonD family hydrolase [Gemmatimonadetes bacterium]|nr:CocE/NonD family hydrolase [Gemmatimonadota bacterium]
MMALRCLRRLARVLPCAGVTVLSVPATTPLNAQARTFDAYIAGVHVAELRVAPTSYAIRKKGFASNRWGTLHAAPAAGVATDTAFLLWGSLRDVAGRIAGIERLGWSGHEVVAWPDRASLYERWRDLRPAGARTPTAARWHRRDASFPMDLVLDGRNRLVAAIDPFRDVVLVHRGDEGYTTVAEWRKPGLSPARHGYRALGKQMVPMPDGVRLATLVYLPSEDAPGPYPTILVRSPYGISGSINGFWHYAARGYAVVFQATRGTSYGDPENRSEGDLELMVHEPADGKATLDWIAQQPWSTGGVCMQGGSYLGYTQWTAAMSGHPALKCLIPEVSMGTAFADQPYVGGGLLVGMAYYAFWMNNRPLVPGRTWTEVLTHRPLIDLDTFGTGANIAAWDAQLLNASNNAYWQRQDWHRGGVRPDLATFQLSGWFDDDLPGTLSNWALMQRTGTAPQRLVLGPWKHGYNADRRLNGYSYGLGAVRDDLWLLKQQWYDAHLKGMPNASTSTRVEYFTLGENAWRTASAWPPREAELQRWYFHSDGQANRLFTSGRLAREAPVADEPVDRYTYDPADPVPNWMSFEQMQRWEDVQTFQWDMKDIEARHDVVTFTSAPLEQDLTIAGEILVELHASTDVKDTDWWVHVSDVDEAGKSQRLTLGGLRARFRELRDPQYRTGDGDFAREVLLSGNPADVVPYRIGIKGIANTFRRGHRIRIAIMNAMANYTFPNSNTGGDEARATTTIPGRMGIHHTRAYPSHVVLPVLPAAR